MRSDSDDELAYSVRENSGRFEVRNLAGRTIMVCNDKNSAEHYSLLLNDAFESGCRYANRSNELDKR